MINFAKYSLLAYLLLKPFYIFSSGGLQLADAFLLLAFALLFVSAWHIPAERKRLFGVFQEHRLFVIFVACTIIINTLYAFMYPDFTFMLSSLYFVFNLLAIVVFAVCLKDRKFLQNVGTVFKFNMLLQLGIWAAGIGRLYSADRYMGTFNDPNQFGYYILLSLLFIYVIDVILKKKRTYIYYIVALFLILESGSTGMLFGIGTFSVLIAILAIKKQLESPYTLLRRIMYSVAVVVVLAVPLSVIVFSSFGTPQERAQSVSEQGSIFSRLDEKTDKVSGDADMSIIEDRHLDIITEYPHYVLYGSGEGALKRFNRAAYPGEIHSTFPSVLFYYGMVPFIILMGWIYSQLKNVKWNIMIACLSLFAVSFILLNQRQALFWALIVLVAMTALPKATAIRPKRGQI